MSQPSNACATGEARTLAWKAVRQPRQPLSSPPLFISLILLVGQLSFGILESYTRTLLAIVTSIVAELVLGRIFLDKWPHLASAYITGISVGILVRSPAFWPYALCSADRHHLEVRAARQRPPHLESVQLRHLRHVLPRVRAVATSEHSVGQHLSGRCS